MADTQLGQNAHKIRSARRMVPIVPVIPRKLETNPKPNERGGKCSPTNEMIKPAMSDPSTPTNSSFIRLRSADDELCSSPKEETPVEAGAERPRNPVEIEMKNRENLKKSLRVNVQLQEAFENVPKSKEEPGSCDEVNETLRSPSNEKRGEISQGHSSPSQSIQDGVRSITTTSNLRDLVTQKNEFMLPPPFYPRSSNHFLPCQPQPHLQKLQQDSSVESNLSYTAHPSTPHPYIATPPDDNVSPIEAGYRGYGHISYASVQPDHTPPTDPSTSPTNDSDNMHSGTTENISKSEENSLIENRPPSPCSFYQGYTYGNVGPTRPGFLDNSSFIHDASQARQVDLPPPHEYEYMLSSSFYGRPDDQISTKTSTNSLESRENITSMAGNTLRHHMANVDDSISESRQSWAHGVSPTSSLGSFHQQNQSSSSEFHVGGSIPATEFKYECGRSATLQLLNQTIIEVSPSQTPLPAYLLDQFDKPKYADIRLEVIHERDGLPMAEFYLHSLIMGQNMWWQDLVESSRSEQQGLKLIKLWSNDQYVTPQAIRAALRVFYGEPSHLFIGSCLQIDFSKSNTDTSVTWMDNALAFAASGYLLGLDEVITRGLHIASSILNWDNVEKALSFALNDGLDPDLDPCHALRVESLLSSSADCSSFANQGANDLAQAATRPCTGFRTPQPKTACSRRSYSLMSQCLNYIASNFPPSWNLVVSAFPLAEIDRLPVIAKSHSPSNKSRLIRMQFGDCPPEIFSMPRNRDAILSSILLSLPFMPLKHILDQVVEPTRSRILGPIVDERERRRTQVLKDGEMIWSQKIVDADHWAHVGWKEFVVPNQDSSLAFERRWTNFYEPPNI